MGRKTPLLNLSLPWVTLSIAICCLWIHGFPDLARQLIYDRQALFEGELWRLWSGHLVHFSSSHLFYNLAVFVVAGAILERESSSRFALFCIFVAGAIGIILFACEPQMLQFGGLSGLIIGILVCLAMQIIHAGNARAPIGWVLLLLVGGKILWEAVRAEPIFVAPAESVDFVPALFAHVAGAFGGLVFCRIHSFMPDPHCRVTGAAKKSSSVCRRQGGVQGTPYLTAELSMVSPEFLSPEFPPHGAVEDALHAALNQTGVLAVTSVPDDKRGEKLVIVHTPEAGDAETLHRLLAASDLPNLWKPGRDCYVAVETLPLLGTGKLDLRGVREAALAGMASAERAECAVG